MAKDKEVTSRITEQAWAESEAAFRHVLELSDPVLRKTMNSDICFSWQKLIPKIVFLCRRQ
jgi:hypothetical protein